MDAADGLSLASSASLPSAVGIEFDPYDYISDTKSARSFVLDDGSETPRTASFHSLVEGEFTFEPDTSFCSVIETTIYIGQKNPNLNLTSDDDVAEEKPKAVLSPDPVNVEDGGRPVAEPSTMTKKKKKPPRMIRTNFLVSSSKSTNVRLQLVMLGVLLVMTTFFTAIYFGGR